MPDDWERVDTGAPDPQMLSIARMTAEDYEPLITEVAFDNPLDPETLHLHTDAGIRTNTGRFDVTWTTKHYYKYHYTEGSTFNYRYDRHPRIELPDEHFHEPPEASHDDAVQSCIVVEPVRLVTLAVLQLWRDTVESGNVDYHQQPNPP